jgi:hypothetical protein
MRLVISQEEPVMALSRSNRIAALQAKVDRIVRVPPSEHAAPARLNILALPESEAFLPDGLPAASIHEVEGTDWDAETGIAPTGFAAAMLARMGDGVIFWVVRDDGAFRAAAWLLQP